MKKKTKILLTTTFSLSSILIASSVVVGKNYFQPNNLLNNLNDSKSEDTLNQNGKQTLTVKNTKIDLNNSALSNGFKEFFTPLYPEDFKKLITDTTKVQYLLNELVSYSDKKNPLAIFETDLPFEEFYNKYSQMQKGIFNPDKAIVFSYDDDATKNTNSSIANGTMKGKIKIGKDLVNQFQFSTTNNGNSTEIEFELNNLQYQFDIYFRNQALGQDNWDKTNVADDAIVKPFIIEGKEAQTILQELTTKPNDFTNFVLDNFIIYDHHNGKKIADNSKDNRNKILATNLSKDDFKNRKILETVIAEPFVGSGKFRIFIKFNTYSFRNKWLDQKPKSINDDRGTFVQLENDAAKVFWLAGWKKDYSFNFLKTQTELDSEKLILNPFAGEGFNNFLKKYTPEQIEKLINQKQCDDLFKGLVNFSAYLFKNPGGLLPLPVNALPEKLLTTNLIFEEFKTLTQKNPFRIFANNYGDNVYLDNFKGTFSGMMVVDDFLVKQHYIESPDNTKYDKFDQSSKIGLDFKLKNLRKKMFFKPNDFEVDQNNFINVEWLNNQTIKDFFGANIPFNDVRQISEQDLKTIKEKILKNFVKYNHNNFDNLDKNDFKIFPILTNAITYDDLEKAVSLSTNDLSFDLLKGTLGASFTFKFKNGILNDKYETQEESSFTITFKLKGFKPDKNNGQYDFNSAPNQNNNNTNVVSIQEFNKVNPQFIAYANEIDRNWILDNLIKYEVTTTKPFANANNSPAIFTTSATKEQFLNEMLYTNQNNQGIELTVVEDQSRIDGKIFLKKSSLNKPPSFDINSSKDYYVYNFQIKDFLTTIDTEFVSHFNIQMIENDFSLDNLNEQYLIDNLFSFSDFQKKQYIVKTNLTKNAFLKKVLAKIEIEKNYKDNQATIKITTNNQEVKLIQINGFNSQIKFAIKNEIYIDDADIALVNIKSHEFILEKFMNFDNSNQNQNSILNTNISLQEFNNDYLDYLNISQKNYQGNWLDLTLHLKQPINNLDLENKTINFRIFFEKNQINIYDINEYFSINEHNLSPELFKIEDIVNFISFNGSLKKEQSIFSINISKEEFLALVKITKVGNPNPKNGSVNLKFSFTNKKVNIDDETINNINVQSYEISVFGFRANGQINFNSQVNAAAYPEVFSNIQAIADLDKNFIFDNLIAYANGAGQAIIGYTNLTKEELFNNTNINFYQKDKSVVIEFLFKSHLNGNQAMQSIEIKNLPFLGFKPYQSFNFITLTVIFSILSLGIIGLITWLIIYKKNKKRRKIIFNATNSNKIL